MVDLTQDQFREQIAMTDSFISTTEATTTYSGATATQLYRGITISRGLRLWQSGIQPSAAWTKTATLKAASQLTGKEYGRGPKELERAIADMDVWVVEMRAKVPVKPSPTSH